MDACLVKSNLGLSKCAKLPGMISSMITTPPGFKATAIQAADPLFWQTSMLAVINLRIYLWPRFVGFTDNSEQAVYENTPLAVLAVRDGRYNFKFEIKESLYFHKAMITHQAIGGRVFFFDLDNQLLGTSDSAGNFMGFTVLLLNTEKLVISNGTISTKSPMMVVLSDNLELDLNGTLISAPFLNTLNRLTDVTLTIVGSPSVNGSLVVKVTLTGDGTTVNGLVLADFILLTAAGAAQTTPPTTATEVDGTYTLSKVAGSPWVAGTLNLRVPSLLSIQAYESTGAVIVTPV